VLHVKNESTHIEKIYLSVNCLFMWADFVCSIAIMGFGDTRAIYHGIWAIAGAIQRNSGRS
jgi:hypothetical protein